MAGGHGTVIVGGGYAAGQAAVALRKGGYTDPVTVFCAEDRGPYERPPLSKEYLRGEQDAPTLVDLAGRDVDVRPGRPVDALDLAGRSVRAGDDVVGYDRLILATGATAVRPDLPGAGADHVLTLRTIEDADAIRARASAGGRVVVAGGSWIGAEVAASLRSEGLDVVVVGRDRSFLPTLQSREAGDRIAAVHRAHGVDVRLDTSLRAVTPTGVELSDGTSLDASLVVFGAGVTPDVALADDAGLTLESGAVRVDASLTTSDPHVLAVGDVAANFHPLYGTHVNVAHWDVAGRHGRHAATVVLGNTEPFVTPPFFFSDQYDLGFEYRGWADPSKDQQVVLRGSDDPTDPWFVFWLIDGAVRAAMNVNAWDDGDALERLVAAQPTVDPARLTDVTVGIDDLV